MAGDDAKVLFYNGFSYRYALVTTYYTYPELDFAHSIIGRVVEFQWLMWLNEARTDIPIHLMSPNPGPGHGGMSCASPSKPTFSMAWRHNRNAKNAQSRAQLSI